MIYPGNMKKTVCLKPKKKILYHGTTDENETTILSPEIDFMRYLIGNEFLFVTLYTISDADNMRFYVLH